MMTATEHVQGEELMAWVDGELAGAELRGVEEHVAGCALCAAEVAQLRQVASGLREWSVAAVPASAEDAVLRRVRAWGAGVESAPVRWWSRRWVWGVGGGVGALGAAMTVLLLVFVSGGSSKKVVDHRVAERLYIPSDELAEVKVPPPPPPPGLTLSFDKKMRSEPATAVMKEDRATSGLPREAGFVASAPMIARTVSLQLEVKDVGRAREGVEGLLRAYGGYAATMTVSTPEAGTRMLGASLRVPAPQLRGMLAELKGFGKVENETQGGEEVGQQHEDLVARLSVARESEARLRGILKTRPGTVADVLEVEEEIARVRGEIEQMEAEQQGLEHRVSYATVQVEAFEEGQGTAADTVWSRLKAGAREGGANAVGTVVFLLEYGLAALVSVALVLVPAWLLWRRWRKVRGRW